MFFCGDGPTCTSPAKSLAVLDTTGLGFLSPARGHHKWQTHRSYPDLLRRIRFHDAPTDKTLVLLTNHLSLLHQSHDNPRSDQQHPVVVIDGSNNSVIATAGDSNNPVGVQGLAINKTTNMIYAVSSAEVDRWWNCNYSPLARRCRHSRKATADKQKSHRRQAAAGSWGRNLPRMA